MAVSGVGETKGNYVYPEGVDKNLGNSSLGIDDFLTLLTAQLQNQNMMEPASDTEFIAQMAQFSTLQQMKDLSAMFQTTQAVSFIGKNVFVKNDAADDASNAYITGVVLSVNFEEGTPYLLINDKYYPMSAVTDVYTYVPPANDGTDTKPDEDDKTDGTDTGNTIV